MQVQCSEELRERLTKYHVMLEEQQGTNYRLTEELAAKGEQILQLKEALDEGKPGGQGTLATTYILQSTAECYYAFFCDESKE